MFCSNCGQTIDSEERFCSKCGAPAEKAVNIKKGISPIATMLIILAAVVLIAGVVLAVVFSGTGTQKTLGINGNTTGNISNFGIAASQGDWIYYLEIDPINFDNQDFGAYGGSIYKIKTDDTKREMVSDDNALFLNVAGDWIYYLKVDPISQVNDPSDIRGSIYKIKTDGTKHEKLSDDNALFINVAGDWIYYLKVDPISNVNDPNAYGGSIYKIKTDGTEGEMVSDDNALFINVVGDWIYYLKVDPIGDIYNITSSSDITGGIYKIKTDGTKREMVSDDMAAFINVVGDWIYYSKLDPISPPVNGPSDITGGIYKIKTDGTEGEMVSDDLAAFINVVGDWIYYAKSDFNNFTYVRSIYKIKTDGTKRELLVDDIALPVNVIDDWIYYGAISESDLIDSGIYRIKTDGSDKQPVSIIREATETKRAQTATTAAAETTAAAAAETTRARVTATTAAAETTTGGYYNIGDTGPAGGLIFYVNPNYQADGWRYLEAAPGDFPGSNNDYQIQWHNGYYLVTGATETAIGTGKSNTQKIVNMQGSGDYAAKLCDDLILNGYNDWFMPSKDELNLMYKNLYLNGIGSFAYDTYWSSSEYNADDAWFHTFANGWQGNDVKNFNIRVRAVRAFY